MRTIKEIILHCSATPEGKDYKKKDIDKWHKQQGWKSCGYHYVIDLDGTVERGREDKEVGAHCSGHNSYTLGICYIGGVDAKGNAKDSRTQAQKSALLDLVYLLLEQYHLALDNVRCHNEYSSKACPSFKIEDFRNEYRKAFKL